MSSTSAAQLAANRANSQPSTGPTTAEGKQKSSLNAVKTGLTGRTVLLPTDDAKAYEAHVQLYTKIHRPQDQEQRDLVQALADALWRIDRIPVLEYGIYALGHLEFAHLFENEDPDAQNALIDAKTYLVYQKQIRNLHLQEARLMRQFQKIKAKLSELQAPSLPCPEAPQPKPAAQSESIKLELAKPQPPKPQPAEAPASPSSPAREKALHTAAMRLLQAIDRDAKFEPARFNCHQNGFVFSFREIKDRAFTINHKQKGQSAR